MDDDANAREHVGHDVAEELAGLREDPVKIARTAFTPFAQRPQDTTEQAFLLGQTCQLDLPGVHVPRQDLHQVAELVDDGWYDEQANQPDDQNGPEEGGEHPKATTQAEAAQRVDERCQIDCEENGDEGQKDEFSYGVDEQQQQDDEDRRRQYAIRLA